MATARLVRERRRCTRALRCAGGPRRHDTDPMGMDPTRPHRRRPADLLYVGAGLLVVAALLVWALLG